MLPTWLVRGPFAPEFYTPERCYIADESPEACLALARVEPGVATRLDAVTGVVER